MGFLSLHSQLRLISHQFNTFGPEAIVKLYRSTAATHCLYSGAVLVARQGERVVLVFMLNPA